jgi:hypothetical protein
MTGAPSPAPLTEEQPHGLSYPARIVNTFIAPAKTFTDLKRKSGWWVPFLIIAIVSVFFVWTVDSKIGFDKVTENQIKLNAKAMDRLEKLPPEQRARQLEISAKVTRIISYASPVLVLAIFVIIAAVWLATFNLGLGTKLGFGTAFAVVMYASLPGVLRSLLAVITLFAGVDPDGFIMQNPVATNLGGLFEVSTHPALYSIGSSIDIFAIWSLILTGIGFSCVSKIKRGTAIAVVFGWYVVYVLGAAALTLMF